MAVTPTISYRNVDPSTELSTNVKERLHKLEQFCDHISHCDVMIERPHNSHNKGGRFHVRIRMTIPGVEIVADRDPCGAADHTDVHAAIRDAFEALRRQLLLHRAKRRRSA